jgi:hypothetical protein
MAIIEGLDDQLQWSDEDRRRELADVFKGIFRNCIGMCDVKEFQVVKLQDPLKERRTWSGKKKSIAINCCLCLITPGGILTFMFVLEKMIGKY